jgi:hypothetical protein
MPGESSEQSVGLAFVRDELIDNFHLMERLIMGVYTVGLNTPEGCVVEHVTSEFAIFGKKG